MKKFKYKKPFIIKNALFALALALIIVVNIVALQFSTALELYFGEIGGGGTSSEIYTSAYATADELRVAQEGFARDVAGEGAVLLKNEADSLPLASGSNVTLLGSGIWYNAGTGSGAIANREYSHITPTFTLEQAGFAVNPSTTDYAGFTDAAIYVISRQGGEGADGTLADPESERYMQLRDSERAELAAISRAGFGKIVVVMNTSNAMNMDFIDMAEYGIDACLWLGPTGCNGLEALGALLAGQVNPSGHLPDTYLYDITSNPAMQNFGNMVYEGTSIPYINYVEGIYLGYKYFETRYEDAVMGAANVGNYDYDAIVYRPFGFGLSYTQFDWSGYQLTENADGTVTVTVTITNAGGIAGKEVVQVYYQAPYTDYDRQNQVEKASVNLAAFGKTNLLEPGASETVEISFDAQELMKSYDAYGARTYIMDEGQYYITAAADAHDAVNQILSAKDYNTDGDAALVGTYSVNEFLILDTDSVTQAPVTNLFDFAVAEDTEYLSRQNWSRVEAGLAYTYPGTNIDNLVEHYNRNSWAASGRPAEQNNTAEFITDADNGLTIGDMTGLDYNDPQWDQLLDQMSITEMHDLFKRAGYTTAAIESIGKVRTYDFDGPAGIVNFVSGWGSFGYPTELVLASTWNQELATEMGRLVGEDGLRADIQGWYAPSMNLHRTALSGRNFEYFSEDAVLSGYMGAAETKGAMSMGMYVYIKHYAVNDQEENRSTAATWLNEQSMRELYLKPFEMSIKLGGATGVMGSMNRIGIVKAVGSYALMTEVLRDEWGFQGGVITDYVTYSAADADQIIAAGTNLILQTSEVPMSRTNSWARRNVLRDSAHEVLYMVANSIAVDAGGSGFPIYIFIMIGFNLLTLGGLVVGEVFAVKRAIHGAPVLTDAQRKKKRIITLVVIGVIVLVIALIAAYFVQEFLSRQLGQ